MPPQIVCSMHLCSYHTKLGGKLSFHAFREVMHLEEMQIERFDCIMINPPMFRAIRALSLEDCGLQTGKEDLLTN